MSLNNNIFLFYFLAASFDYHGQESLDRDVNLSQCGEREVEGPSKTKFNIFKCLQSRWLRGKYTIQ